MDLFFQWNLIDSAHFSYYRTSSPLPREYVLYKDATFFIINSSIITQLLWHWLQKLKIYLVWVAGMWPTLFEARFGMSSCIYDFAHLLIVSLSGTGKIPIFELGKTIFCLLEKKKNCLFVWENKQNSLERIFPDFQCLSHVKELNKNKSLNYLSDCSLVLFHPIWDLKP